MSHARTDRRMDARRELAHGRAYDDLYVYGECRDSEQLKAANLSAGLIADSPAQINFNLPIDSIRIPLHTHCRAVSCSQSARLGEQAYSRP